MDPKPGWTSPALPLADLKSSPERWWSSSLFTLGRASCGRHQKAFMVLGARNLQLPPMSLLPFCPGKRHFPCARTFPSLPGSRWGTTGWFLSIVRGDGHRFQVGCLKIMCQLAPSFFSVWNVVWCGVV